jgi:phospholipid/cholesterol/gamma-HCH transport system substrate-binding protein
VNYALVGTFVLILGSVLVAIALWLASGGAFQKKYDLYLAIENESVSGLNLNATIKYNGVDVGKVQQISLDHSDPDRVILLFAIEKGTPIRVDTVAVLKTQGLTGLAYVELSGGSKDSALLKKTADNAYPVIMTKPSLSARMENVLTSVMTKLDSTSENINTLLSGENQAAFKSALADIATVAHTIALRKDDIDAGIGDAARAARNVSHASLQLSPVISQIGDSANAVTKMGNEVAQTSITTGKLVESVGADAQRFTSETLPELERLLGELTVLSTSMRRLSEQIERNPNGLLFGRVPVSDGPGESESGESDHE